MVYAAAEDPACYSGTNVLKNKAGLVEQSALDEFELAMSLIRADEPWPEGSLDYEHYLAMHHHLFQDVYDWAGSLRKIRIGKAGNWFCYPEHIDAEMRRIFNWLESKAYLAGQDIADFRSNASYLLSELNAVHPFRDGNGRTQMAFLTLLTERSGFRFNENALEPEAVMQSMILSFSGNIKPLNILLDNLILP